MSENSLMRLSPQFISVPEMVSQDALIPHYQGIFDLSDEVLLGYESLIRTRSASVKVAPDRLFQLAQEQDSLFELDYHCLLQALSRKETLRLEGLLFVNLLPEHLSEIYFRLEALSEYYDLTQLVIEISEKQPLHDIEALRSAIKLLQKLGVTIAVDDLGAGYSGLKTWAEIRPNYVKIDRHFIQNIHLDNVKREFVRSIIEISRGIGCQVIAEGIESFEELEVVNSMGIKFAQGYFLQRPQLVPEPPALPKLSKSDPLSLKNINTSPAHTAESLLRSIEPLSPTMLAEQVNDIFKQRGEISSLPIVDDGKPVGIVSRLKVLELFSGRYSHQLHGKKTIAQYMDESPIVVDYQASLKTVSKKITSLSNKDLNMDFIITRDDRYLGVGRVVDLLEQITDLQVRSARYSNPLTNLPGNVPIHEWIDELISQKQEFTLAYLDLNHFKPFNDYFGYSTGDEAILLLSDVVSRNLSSNMDRVGHVGGDDFVILFRSELWEQCCQKIIMDFDMASRKFYSDKEIDEGGIWSKNREGHLTFFRLLSLAIGVCHPDVNECESHHDVALLAAETKHQAKRHDGNHLFVSRRRSVGPLRRQRPTNKPTF